MDELAAGIQKGAQARHAQIVGLVRQRGFVTIEKLAQQFDVTVQTIRRDLTHLAEDGKVSRFHGGAGLPSSVENIDYSTRKVLNLAEKKRIAQLVARHVPDHSSLFINIGTTTEAVARELLGHQDLRVHHQQPECGADPAGNWTEFKVVVAGGTVRSRDGGIVGQSAGGTT